MSPTCGPIPFLALCLLHTALAAVPSTPDQATRDVKSSERAGENRGENRGENGVVPAVRLIQLPTALLLPPARDLRVDGLNPDQFAESWQVGMVPVIDNPKPVFSWTIPPPPAEARGVTVGAFRVIVQAMDRHKEPSSTWDSGVVSPPSMKAAYAGPPLVSGQRYCFAVWWQAAKLGSWAPVSEHACFETGISGGRRLSQSDRKGKGSGLGDSSVCDTWSPSVWIGDDSLNVYRSEFKLSTEDLHNARAARVYASGMGWGQLFLNGHEITKNESLGVGWTRYDKRSLYVTYSVLPLLKSGSNGIGAMLGIGWRDRVAFEPRHPGDNDSGYTGRALRLVLRLQLEDGSWLTKAHTSSKWKGIAGPVVFDSVYDGETFDARKKQKNWSKAGTNLTGWSAVADLSHETWAVTTRMVAQTFPPVRVQDEIAPRTVDRVGSGHYVIDFGVNLAGVVRLTLPKAKRGQAITIRHAEEKIHPPYGNYSENGTYLYYGNLRRAKATDSYIYSGEEPAGTDWKPSFTYHGFRYVEVTGWPCVAEDCASPDVTMLHFRSDLQVIGNLSTSDPVINGLYRMVVGSQASNLMTLPTDCPQRDERLGWMGDAGLSSESMSLNFDMPALHDAFLSSIVDEQHPDGSIPDVVPFVRYGERPADPSWSAAFPAILYARYKFGGDLTPYRTHRSALNKYFQNMYQQFQIGGGFKNKQWGYYGDWVPAKEDQKPSITFTSGAMWIASLAQAQEMASAAKDNVFAAEYKKNHTLIATQFFKAYYNPKTNTIENGGQSAMALGLELQVLPAPIQAKVAKNLAAQVRVSGTDVGHLTVGILGARTIFYALVNNGYAKEAMDLIKGEGNPSYGYMVSNDLEPATTNMWELWDAPVGVPNMDSRNHHMFSSVGTFLFDVAGLLGSQNHGLLKRGSKGVELKVGGCCGGLDSACVHSRAPGGRIGFCWEKKRFSSCANATVPLYPSAELTIPLSRPLPSKVRIFESKKLIFAGTVTEKTQLVKIAESKGITAARVDRSPCKDPKRNAPPTTNLRFSLGSGTYSFEVLEMGV